MKRRLPKWKTALLVGAIVVSTLMVMALDVQGTKGATWVESVVISALAPIQKAITRAARRVEHLWSSYVNLVGVQAENETLKGELQAMRAENSRLLEENLKFHRLQKLLAIQRNASELLVLANVVGLDTTTWSNVVMVDRGEDDGVAKEMIVVSADGLVGRVIQTSPKVSKVLVLTDFRHAVDALVQRTRDRGVVVGWDRSSGLMKYIPLEAEIEVGDRVVSSGMGGLYPKGLVIGTITRVTTSSGGLHQEAIVRPSTDLDRLEEVFIIAKR
ncbi:MAG: rod shape-determining protein MreC [Candidatus Tectimicrobiota bacterium]